MSYLTFPTCCVESVVAAAASPLQICTFIDQSRKKIEYMKVE
jgi:hypothetical protein